MYIYLNFCEESEERKRARDKEQRQTIKKQPREQLVKW